MMTLPRKPRDSSLHAMPAPSGFAQGSGRAALLLMGLMLALSCQKGGEETSGLSQGKAQPDSVQVGPLAAGDGDVAQTPFPGAVPQQLGAPDSGKESAQPPEQKRSAPDARRHQPFKPSWEHRTDRIVELSHAWARLSDGDRQSRLKDELSNVINKHKCNLVMGCVPEEFIIGAGRDAVMPIIELYSKIRRDSFNKFHLIRILGEIGSEEAVPFLVGLLDAKEWFARANAAFALGLMGQAPEPAGLAERFDAVRDSADAAYAYALAYALARSGDHRGKETLLGALRTEAVKNGNWGYTRYAVEAVGLLGYSEACPFMVDALRHADLFLRKEALRTVARLSCRELPVLESVVQSLDHPARSLRDMASETLKVVLKVSISSAKSWSDYKKNVLKVEE